MWVIAHFMNDDERAAALELMPGAEVTDSYLIGDVAEGTIAQLEDAGLIVQRLEPLEDEAEAEELRGRGIVRDASRRRARGPAIAAAPPAGPAVFVIRLGGPLLPRWQEELDGLDIALLEHIPRYAYTARLNPDQVGPVGELPFVADVRLYDREDAQGAMPERRRSRGPRAAASVGAEGRKMITYDVRLHPSSNEEERRQQLAKSLAWLEDRGVAVAGSGRGKIRLYLLEDDALYDEILDRDEIEYIEPYVPPVLLNDVARGIIGLDAPGGGLGLPQTGAGQIVAVADTGIDESHPDFQGRILATVALGRNDASDPHGHGTHVAGSVLGDGSASGGDIEGTAPEAELFFQSLLDSGGGLGGLPVNLYDLFEEAYLANARIHNNSWGAATDSEYTMNSIEVDEFVAARRDMLIVIAAGNEGTAAGNRNAEDGFVDWLSIDSPASAKNALTVGASRSTRSGAGYADYTYGEIFGRSFPEGPIADEKVSGDPEALAAFSSRGPCTDHRIKPDLVAPGTDIASTKSANAPLRNFWGPFPGNASYAVMGGTSMATPLVTGCAALVRQYFTDERDHSPSAALLKATLINSTRWLRGADATADHGATPNYHQGFGCIHMPFAIPNPGVPDMMLEFADTWEDGPKLAATGKRVRYQVTGEAGRPLRVCLVWTDPPARALQNNLNLFVQHLETREKWMGNADLPMSLGIPDPENNVEIVRIENPPAGTYRIQISATNLLKGGQDFAVVVTGDLTSELAEV